MSEKYDILVIGSGPGGYVSAIKAAQAGKKVAIVEKKHLGGICLNWGCIPTKALLKSAEVLHHIEHAADFGIEVKGAKADYKKIIARSRGVADTNSQGVKFLMKKNKITVIDGIGKLISKGIVEVDNGTEKFMVSSDKIIIATGASAREIPAYPIDGKNFITYRKALELDEAPKKILVVGSGAIGVEFSYFFNTLGVEVHLVEMLDQIVPVEDHEISKTLEDSFKKQGINVYTSTTVEEATLVKDGEINVTLKDKFGTLTKLTVDRALIAIGMVPNTNNLGLKEAGVRIDQRGFIEVDKHQETSMKGIYAIGDCTGKQMLAHKASFEGEAAVAHILGEHTGGIDYSQIPGCTYCQPQVASVGMTENKAKEKGIEYKVGRFPFMASGKARAIGHVEGMVKLIFEKKYGGLIGAHIIGSEATEMLAELSLALKLEATWEDIAHTIHAHPTLSEAVMEAALDSEGISPHL